MEIAVICVTIFCPCDLKFQIVFVFCFIISHFADRLRLSYRTLAFNPPCISSKCPIFYLTRAKKFYCGLILVIIDSKWLNADPESMIIR